MSQTPPIQQILLDLLSRDHIGDVAGLRVALNAISTLPAIGSQAVVEGLLSTPELFAYIISVSDHGDEMISLIMTDFPTSPQEYPSSVASKMLDTLSMYFLALPVESLMASRDLNRHRGFVKRALPVLCALSTLTFPSKHSYEGSADLCDVEPDDGFIKLRGPHKIRKLNLRKPGATVDTSLFVKLGVNVPHTSEAATLMSISVLAKLREILTFYLSLLRKTELAGDIKALLFSKVGEFAKHVTPEFPSTGGVDRSAQPMKAVLYFDNANGFGEWQILISTGAYEKLREFRRDDKNICKMIVKKIKQLSNGHFSDDDHKRLSGPDAGIPIYEAKMTGDLRLVYQVDCVLDSDGEIRIFVDGKHDTEATLDSLRDKVNYH